MEKVYLVMKRTSVDYHGTYEEVVSVYEDKSLADALVDKLNEENYVYDIEYYCDTYDITKK